MLQLCWSVYFWLCASQINTHATHPPNGTTKLNRKKEMIYLIFLQSFHFNSTWVFTVFCCYFRLCFRTPFFVPLLPACLCVCYNPLQRIDQKRANTNNQANLQFERRWLYEINYNQTLGEKTPNKQTHGLAKINKRKAASQTHPSGLSELGTNRLRILCRKERGLSSLQSTIG